MANEQDFEVVKFEQEGLFKYLGASYPEDRRINADIYMTMAMMARQEENYATVVPRFRPEWPTPQEYADEALTDVLHGGWEEGNIPDDIRRLLATTKVAIFTAHGEMDQKLGWYAHIRDEEIIPVRTLVERHLSDYETILVAVCNPSGARLEPIRGSVIYPVTNFGVPRNTQMIVSTA